LGRIGERPSHTWFVVKYLLRDSAPRNESDAWTESGTLGTPAVYRFTAATTTLLAPKDFVIRFVLSEDDFAK